MDFKDVFKAALDRAGAKAARTAQRIKGQFRDRGWMKQGWASFAGSSTTLRDQRQRRFNRQRTRPARVAASPNRPTYKNEPKLPRRKHQNDITHVGALFRP